ncbi:hypothetical protein AQUCO_04700099v1 [Aquilegia coerulea]|uniref:F-box/LRR-repeat protein 15/At3g58940/PEG3-like LRR domain-containing protein n=1 Tax=Aquilegia coerulea TaxID=218851 RepID=A0A2G5CL62_AQUCA|nr:hypothetical protein AQUCO_04700099v1 [Aquilegia coerulea]
MIFVWDLLLLIRIIMFSAVLFFFSVLTPIFLYIWLYSVLSTRWKYIWTSISKLDICDKLLYTSTSAEAGNSNPMLMTSFMNFVDRVLLLHKMSAINKFSLSCKKAYDVNHVGTWISAVLSCNVQDLCLDISMDESFVFPSCLYGCESLTTLKIMDGCLKIPTSVYFPNLKVLHLADVSFCGRHPIQQVVFRFPVLQEFSACDIRWREIDTVDIYAPLLKTLLKQNFHNNHISI